MAHSCLLHLIMQNCLLESFLRTVTLMTQVSLHLITLLELVPVTPKLVKKVTTDLDSLKTSGP